MRRSVCVPMLGCALVVAVVFGNINVVHGALYLKFDDGSNSVTTSGPVPPGSIGVNLQPLDATFSVVLTAGSAQDPTFAPPLGPGLDLSLSSIKAVAAGTLKIFLTYTDLQSTGTGLANLAWKFKSPSTITGTTTVTSQAWVNLSNTKLDEPSNAPPGAATSGLVLFTNADALNDTVNKSTPFGPNPPNPIAPNFAVTAGSPFSLTIEVDIIMNGGSNQAVSGDFLATVQPPSGFQIQEGPEPASMAIWGLGIALAGGARCVRRKRTVA